MRTHMELKSGGERGQWKQHDNAARHDGSIRKAYAPWSELVEKGRFKIVWSCRQSIRERWNSPWDWKKERLCEQRRQGHVKGRVKGHLVKQLKRTVQGWARAPEALWPARLWELKIPWNIIHTLNLDSVYVSVSTFSGPWLNISHHLVLLFYVSRNCPPSSCLSVPQCAPVHSSSELSPLLDDLG